MNPTLDWIAEKNNAWRADLRNVSLVIELDIADEDLETAVSYLGGLLRNNHASLIRANYPAFLVVSLTAAGMAAWEEGTFYDKVAQLTGASAAALNAATREYRKALNVLDLPTFAEAGGMAWVTPVLLHGGIPLDHLDELMDIVAARRRRDPSVDGEAVVLWARTSPGALTGQPRALTRFIEFGGDFAPDYVGRIVDYLDGDPVSLPRKVIERLDTLVQGGRTQSRRIKQARPVLALDHEQVPVLRLPPTKPCQGREVQWRIAFDGSVQQVTLAVPYGPSSGVTTGASVPVPGPTRTINVEHEGGASTHAFVNTDDPLLVFDARDEFVPSTTPLAPGIATLLWPSARGGPVDVADKPIEGRDLSVPFGWEGWAARTVELPAGGSLRLSGSPPRRIRGDERARLEGGSVATGVRTSDGLPVSAEAPRLLLPRSTDPAIWTVSLSTDDGAVVDRLTPDGWDTDPFQSVPRPVEGTFTVQVRGPLGRGLTRRLAVWEGASVQVEPPFRSLTTGGLTPARVQIRTTRGETVFDLGPSDVAKQITTLAGTTFMIDPPHSAFALVRDGEPAMWRVSAARLATEAMADHSLWIRTDPVGQDARLVLETAGMTQVLEPSPFGTGGYRRDLAAFAETALDGGVGTLWFLTSRQDRVPLIMHQPRQLARGVSLHEASLQIDSDLESGLEAIVYRTLAPWEPGIVLTVTDNRAALPPRCLHGGPLRVAVRAANEWAAEPAGPYPSVGPEAFDLPDVEWDVRGEPHPNLSGYLHDPAVVPDLSATEMALALDLVANSARLPSGLATRADLRALPLSHPRTAIQAVLESSASDAGLTAAMVASSLVAHDASGIADPLLIEPLLARSPLAAQLAASSPLLEDPRGDTYEVMLGTLGDEYGSLIEGDVVAGARVGRFEPAMAQHPHLVAGMYAALDPVPRRILDLDTRVVAAYELWQVRNRLLPQARVAMAGGHQAIVAVKRCAPSLEPLVTERTSHDGVLALPVLTIALALLARLTAHGDDGAHGVYERYRSHHRALARHAPQFTSIDLIRADAALVGAWT